MSSNKARHVCFTWNNPSVIPSLLLATLAEAERIRYVVFQLEEGENGTPHYQGYVEYTSPQRWSYLKALTDQSIHLEKRRGTRVQARDYCRKEESRKDGPFEYGEWSVGGSGSRNDLTGIIDACKTGSLKRVAEEHPEGILRYSKVFPPLLHILVLTFRGFLCSLECTGPEEGEHPPSIYFMDPQDVARLGW